MSDKNEMKEMLLYCIHIAKHKGVFYNEPDFNKAKEYVENMLDQDEIEKLLRREIFTAKHATISKAVKDAEKIIEKLEKQKELING